MYTDPPWVFKGRALYQLQLVKSEEVVKHNASSFHIRAHNKHALPRPGKTAHP
jgi:hypothetical protein